MSQEQDVKQALIEELDKLPDAQVHKVLNFVQQLLSQLNNGSKSEQAPNGQTQPLLSPNDPLSEFIGAASHGALAQSLDEELYGT